MTYDELQQFNDMQKRLKQLDGAIQRQGENLGSKLQDVQTLALRDIDHLAERIENLDKQDDVQHDRHEKLMREVERLTQRIENLESVSMIQYIKEHSQVLTLIQKDIALRDEKHNALCNALYGLIVDMLGVNILDEARDKCNWNQLLDRIRNARIQTGEQEAQDGTSDNGLDIDSSEGCEQVDGDTVGVVDTDSADAIIGEMRKQIGFKFHPNFDAIRQCRLVVDEFVRPHIEKLVGERDRRTNALQNRIGLDTDLLRQRDDAIKRAEKAEAELEIFKNTVDRLSGELVDAEAERDAMREQKDNAYTERNRVVSAFATAMMQLGHKAFIMPHKSDDADWGEWQNVVCIEIDGFGQFTWHIHDRHLPIFSQLKHVDENVWDGHDTEDKYTRLNSVAKWMY